jgi:hypothetical protein
LLATRHSSNAVPNLPRLCRLALMWSLPSTPALVPVSIDHQENENQEPDNEQKNRNRLALPQRLEVFGELIPIHASPI